MAKPEGGAGSTPPCITRDPLFRRVAPSIVVETGTLLATGRRHRRLELPMTGFCPEDVATIVRHTVPCAACGRHCHPFRARRGKSAGRAERPGRLFIALTCELADRIGCSRGVAATSAYERVMRFLDSLHRQPQQLPLFAGGK